MSEISIERNGQLKRLSGDTMDVDEIWLEYPDKEDNNFHAILTGRNTEGFTRWESVPFEQPFQVTELSARLSVPLREEFELALFKLIFEHTDSSSQVALLLLLSKVIGEANHATAIGNSSSSATPAS